MEIKFDKDLFTVEQSNYANKNLKVYIVYDLVASPRKDLLRISNIRTVCLQ